MTPEEKEMLDWYLSHALSFFLKDFFHAGNSDLKFEVRPHNVQSGLWWEATWQEKEGRERRVSAQWQKLLWERLIKEHLIQQRGAHE